ncbi:hydroxyacylglutathione hydrolase [Thalassotalea mangrovi]|uniref:Hydroxyacylglutathione hydrolase n=1 Tax=Thalassotalea mangrovi TaxID=2572245 RepID=A0A4U1B226_9GAMM|nr:hydroxyacylglutathione hydrolase [Thalassotalea mangrovi]TKB43364.1 hydroxyacylglutathione hydrolase [Thalassotalea mangrovi]
MQISAIPAFSDNYIWAISSAETDISQCALVDPGDAAVCIEFLEKRQLQLASILITHHHRDHTGGVAELLDYASARNWTVDVYGPQGENIQHISHYLGEGDTLELNYLSKSFSIIEVPGHTRGHIAYYNDSGLGTLFCGDTLFSGGCGRLFEGTAEQMLNSLQKLNNLPSTTLVYCAHEYTQANLKFARTIEPENSQLIEYELKVNRLREADLATIPTNLAIESLINPFLRSHIDAVKTRVQQLTGNACPSPVEVFAATRLLKDNF